MWGISLFGAIKETLGMSLFRSGIIRTRKSHYFGIILGSTVLLAFQSHWQRNEGFKGNLENLALKLQPYKQHPFVSDKVIVTASDNTQCVTFGDYISQSIKSAIISCK